METTLFDRNTLLRRSRARHKIWCVVGGSGIWLNEVMFGAPGWMPVVSGHLMKHCAGERGVIGSL